MTLVTKLPDSQNHQRWVTHLTVKVVEERQEDATHRDADNDDQVVPVLESQATTSSSSSDSVNPLAPQAVPVLEPQATTSSSPSNSDNQLVPQADPGADQLSDFQLETPEPETPSPRSEVCDQEASELSKGSDGNREDEQQWSPQQEQEKVQENEQEQEH